MVRALGGFFGPSYFLLAFLAAFALGAAFLAAAFLAGFGADFGADFADDLALSDVDAAVDSAAADGDEPNAIEKLSPYFLDGALRTIGPLIP
ncbi:MAG: hypothetical protein RLY70_3788 [Planctomycetota bacterium]